MNCTLDLSHNKQLSVVVWVVIWETSKGNSVHEHFICFLQILDTTGIGSCKSFLGHLEKLGLDLSNCCGQSYDNGSNMQGKKQGLQKERVRENWNLTERLCVSFVEVTCWNLIGRDPAKSCGTCISLFGLLQRLYALFCSSVHRWSVLTARQINFTLKVGVQS